MQFIPVDTRKFLKREIANSAVLRMEDGKKHSRVRNLISGDWIPVSGSPSDHRTMKNFAASLHRLAVFGQGLVYAKTGHLPRNSI